jgi:CelD/BcsL family acetyltransferase involved in cellulose biosynthesis
MTVTVVDSSEGFRDLRAQWQQLLDKSHSNSVFLTWEWLFTWWNWYGCGGRLLILLLKDGSGHLRGIAPLMIRRVMGTFRRLQFIGSDSKVSSDYLDVIAEKGWEERVGEGVMQFLLKTNSQWHHLVLSSIAKDSLFLAAFQQLATIRRLGMYERLQYVAPSISYPRTWDELLARFGYRIRRNIRYYKRGLEKTFRVEFLPWCQLFDGAQTVNAMRRLQHKSISRKGFRGIFEDETFTNFHTEILDLFNKNGWLYVVFLLCDGKPVAFQYGYLYGGIIHGYQRGFDTDYQSYRVGVVLQSYVFQDTINKGLHAYDCLRGDEEYKSHFADSAREMLEVSIFNNNWSSALLRLALVGGRGIKSRLSGILGKNLAQIIRRRIFRF